MGFSVEVALTKCPATFSPGGNRKQPETRFPGKRNFLRVDNCAKRKAQILRSFMRSKKGGGGTYNLFISIILGGGRRI